MRGWTCILEPWFLGGPSHFIPLQPAIVPLPGCYSARCIQKVGSQAHWSEKCCSFQRSNKNGLRQKNSMDFSGCIFLAREKNMSSFWKDFFLLNNITSGNKQMFGASWINLGEKSPDLGVSNCEISSKWCHQVCYTIDCQIERTNYFFCWNFLNTFLQRVHVFDEWSQMEVNEITMIAFWCFFDVPKIKEKTSWNTRSRLPALVF